MAPTRREVMESKLAFLRQFIADLEVYAALDGRARRREHYAIERLLQLLCEAAADIGLQMLKTSGYGLASSYREVFEVLKTRGDLEETTADRLMDACAMRSLLKHLHDTIDLDRVVAAIDPAIALYRDFDAWAENRIA